MHVHDFERSLKEVKSVSLRFSLIRLCSTTKVLLKMWSSPSIHVITTTLAYKAGRATFKKRSPPPAIFGRLSKNTLVMSVKCTHHQSIKLFEIRLTRLHLRKLSIHTMFQPDDRGGWLMTTIGHERNHQTQPEVV